MTKILKKIMIVCCSAVAVLCFCIGAVLGLNTNEIVEAKAATQANYVGIVDDYNMVEAPTKPGRYMVALEYDQVLNAEATTSLTLSDVSVTLDGKGTKNFLIRNSNNITNTKVVEVMFNTWTTANTPYTSDDSITSSNMPVGTRLDVTGSANGYTLEPVTLYYNGTNWQETEPTTATTANYVGIVDDYNMVEAPTKPGRYMVALEYDQVLNAEATTSLTLSDVSVTLDGKGTKNFLIRNSNNITNTKIVEVMFNTWTTANTPYTSDDSITSSNMPVGTRLDVTGSANGYTLESVTLYYNGTNWQETEPTIPGTPDPDPEPEVETANFVQLVNNGGMANAFTETQRILFLQFDKALAPTTTSIHGTGTANNSGDLKDKMTLNGESIAMGSQINFYVNTFWTSEGANATLLEIMFLDYTKLAVGDVLHIPAGALFGDVALSEVKIQYNGTSWELYGAETPDPDPEPEVETANFVQLVNNGGMANAFTETQRILFLQFDRALAPTTTSIHGTGTANNSGDLKDKMTLNGESIAMGSQINFYVNTFWTSEGVNATLLEIMFLDYTKLAVEDVLHIPAGALFGDVALAEVKIQYNGTSWELYETETPDPDPEPEVETANFERVAGCVMDGSVWGMHSILYVKFDKALAPKTTSIHGTGQANNSGNLKDKMTIGGNAIAMGSQINFYVNTFYSAEGTNTTILEIMFVNATASDYTKGTVLHIPEGTLFGDVALSEVTLTFNGATWVDETKLTRVEFVEIDANRNNNNVWGMNYVTILYFDKPLYAEKMSTALAEQVAGDLGANLTLNGVTAKELGVAITFASLSQEGRYGLEIHIPVDKMLKFSEELTQIILKIEAETIFLNNILPELTFYLNEESKWQTDEFIYVYVPPMEVEFTGVSFRYNNDHNTWQTEGEWYLSVFEFSDFLSKTEIKGNSLPLGDKITLNGVKTSELGFIFGIGAYQTSMNVQYPKAALLSILDAPRIELALAEPIEYGDSIIKPFRLYLNKQAIKWELIDGTDTTAPEFNYTGATEITTSAEKPFVIDVSAFDKEDNKSAAIYYVWSEGALDESGKLVKGTHTCTVVAVDKSGNESQLALTVNVGDKDTTAPVISVPDTISAVEGAIPKLIYKAVDDMDGEILCEIAWSEGALDESGKLVAGTHTVTLTATDLTGNTSTKTVTVNVVKVDVPVDSTEPDDSTDSSDTSSTSDTPDPDPAPTDDGCDSNMGTSSALILLALVVGVSALRFIKRKNSEDKE